MSDVIITVDDTAVRNLLAGAPAKINAAMRLGVKDATKYIQSQMQVYPPERRQVSVTKSSSLYSRGNSRAVAGRKGSYWASSYRRTGTLKRSWHTDVSGTGIDVQGRIYSSGAEAPYNFRVQGRSDAAPGQGQAWMHRGRWRGIDEVQSAVQATVNQMFANRIRAEVG